MVFVDLQLACIVLPLSLSTFAFAAWFFCIEVNLAMNPLDEAHSVADLPRWNDTEVRLTKTYTAHGRPR
eukprot:760377-Pleurochrysis_carterae.AAC.1